jgi:hypothetical protein
MTTIIWIVAGLSVGKTTLNKDLIEVLGDEPRRLVEGTNNGVPYCYTRYGVICSLGNLNDSQCSGLDRVSSKLKNEGIEESIKQAVKDGVQFIIVESIMSASTWLDFLKKHTDNLLMVHLCCDFESNVRRLKYRQFTSPDYKGIAEAPVDIRLTDGNYEFIRKTRKQYLAIYEKFKDKVNHSVSIDTTNIGTKKVMKGVLKLINDSLS